MADYLLDKREISKYSYVIHWIPRHIGIAKLGDEDLLTEIQRIENRWKSLFEELDTHLMARTVVDWLQVGSDFCKPKKMNPLTDGNLVRHRNGRNRQKTCYHDGRPAFIVDWILNLQDSMSLYEYGLQQCMPIY